MRLKLAAFLILALFLVSCGYDVEKKEESTEKTRTTEVETTKVEDGDKADNSKIEVSGEDGEKINTGKDGVDVEDGDTKVKISKDGVSVSSEDEDSSDGDGELAEKLMLKGVGVTKTYPCNGRRIIVNGTKNNYTLTGECSRLLVNGVGQEITVEKVGRIVVNGTGNKVIYSEGLDGKEPRISKAGINNSVEKQ